MSSVSNLGGVRWFGVWPLGPTGDCTCPRGQWRQEQRSVALSARGTCGSPGKHPFTPLFPNGLKDSLDSWDDYCALPGVELCWPAAALPDDLWVLDCDGPSAWVELVRLFRSGALSFDSVAAVARTLRGWHVWYLPGGGGWRGSDVVRALGVKSLEAKSRGGYVVVPWPGNGREWWPVRQWAEVVAGASRLAYGWGGRRIASCSPVGGVGPSAVGAGASVEFPAEVWASGVADGGLRDARMATLALRCGELASMAEGARNVTLNRIGYYEGVAALDAGAAYSDVAALLRDAGLRSGLELSEVEATVRSSLGGWSPLGGAA